MRHFLTLVFVWSLFHLNPVSAFSYVLNQGNNTVFVVDDLTGQIIQIIDVGDNPQAIAVSDDETTVYVANTGSNSLSVIETQTFQISETITGFSSPDSLSLDPSKGAFLVVGNNGNGSISIVETSSNSIVATLDVGFNVGRDTMAITSDATHLCVCDCEGSSVAIVNLSTYTAPSLITSIAVGSNPCAATYTNDNHFLLVVNKGSNNLSFIQTATNGVVKTIGVGTEPVAVALNDDNSVALVVSEGNRTLSEISLTITNSLPVGKNPIYATSVPGSDQVFVLNSEDETVSVVEVASLGPKLVTTVNVGPSPTALVPSPSGDKVYVVCTGNKSLSVIDTTDFTVTSINLSGTPNSLAFAPDGLTAYVSFPNDSLIGVVDIASQTQPIIIASEINANAKPYPTKIVVDPDGALVYVLNTFTSLADGNPSVDQVASSFTIGVISTDSNTLIDSLPVSGQSANLLAIDPYGKYLYIPIIGQNSLFTTHDNHMPIIDLNTLETLYGTIGVAPTDIAVTNDGSEVYVLNTQATTPSWNTGSSFSVLSVDSNFSAKEFFLSNREMVYDRITISNTDYAYIIDRGISGETKDYDSDLLAYKNNNSPHSQLQLNGTLSDVAVLPDNSFSFVTDSYNNTVFTAIAAPANPLFNTLVPILTEVKIIKIFSLGFEPTTISSDGTTVRIISNGNQTLSIGPADNPTTQTLSGFNGPIAIAIGSEAASLTYANIFMKHIESDWCTETFALLEWSQFLKATDYVIYRNNEAIATLGPEATSYTDHNLIAGKSYVYELEVKSSTGNSQRYTFD